MDEDLLDVGDELLVKTLKDYFGIENTDNPRQLLCDILEGKPYLTTLIIEYLELRGAHIE